LRRKSSRVSRGSADAAVRAYLDSLGTPEGKAGEVLALLRAEPPWTDDPDSWDARSLPEETLAWLGGLAARSILAGGPWPPEALARARELGDDRRNTLAHVLATYGLTPPPGLEEVRNVTGQSPYHLAAQFGATVDPAVLDLEDGFGTTVRYYALTNGSWKPETPEDFEAPLDRGRGFFEVLLPLLSSRIRAAKPPLSLEGALGGIPTGDPKSAIETLDDDGALAVLLPLAERAALTPDKLPCTEYDEALGRRVPGSVVRGLSMGLILHLVESRLERKDFMRRLQRALGKPSAMVRAAEDWAGLWCGMPADWENNPSSTNIQPDEKDCRVLADCLVFMGGRRSIRVLETLKHNGSPFSGVVLDRFAFLSLRRAARTPRSGDPDTEIGL
jgi:hypothetical protein